MIKSSKSGFTLAEVLTTLMVIGVVAAMTIPTLMNSTQHQQAQVAAKKAASVLGQAVQLLVAQEKACGPAAGTAWSHSDLAKCMNQVMNGTISGDASNILTTADGMAYIFYAPPLKGDFAAVCNSQVSSDYKGKGNCGVVVDTNGLAKETDTVSSATFSGGGFSANPEGGKDQVAFSLSASGVRAMAFDGAGYGYEYMYGKAPTTDLNTGTLCCTATTECPANTKGAGQKYCSTSSTLSGENKTCTDAKTDYLYETSECGGAK